MDLRQRDLQVFADGAGRLCRKAHTPNCDSGYQGLQNDTPDVEISCKRTKLHPLTPDERVYNHGLGRFRVRVEHAFAKIKRFCMFADRVRDPRCTYAAKFAIVAGIVNLAAGF